MYFDDYPKTMSATDKVQNILSNYVEKMGKHPLFLIVNPLQDIKLPNTMNLVVRAQRIVLPKHYWMIEEE